ncbi:extracellular solute-binding protein [Streptomyces sp. NPDC088725]|uniref:extracellular solute-binding protein n=1 Tax=Streptomyces sp. NPDC088725 TaxID=3365873 RepID=UPI0037F529CF
MNSRLPVRSVMLASSLALVSGCGLLPGSAGSTDITIWMMEGSVTDEFVKAFKDDYEDKHPSIDLNIEIKGWAGIGNTVTAALGGKDTPDVIEVGNTQVAQYADSNNLRDLTLESVRDLGSKDWLPGLADPGSIDGAQFGIPWYAANVVVIYNKDLFEQAGIKTPPKTRDEWIDDTTELNQNGNQGIYLSGQDWYTLCGFIWDEGGELATESGGQWRGAIDTPAAIKGMEFYKELQALGKAPKDADHTQPDQAEVFAKGKIAQIISTPGAAAKIEELNPALKGKLGFFPVPGKTADKPGRVLTGGSDLVVPKNSAHRFEAVQVVSELADEKWQVELAKAMSFVPNKSKLSAAVGGGESIKAMAKGAAEGRATPNSPQWANIDVNNPFKPYMTAVLQGKDVEPAAKEASEKITVALRDSSHIG